MKIKKGTILEIYHSRKGKFTGEALEDFETGADNFYPIVLVSETVSGMATYWEKGEKILCKGSLCTIKIKGGK